MQYAQTSERLTAAGAAVLASRGADATDGGSRFEALYHAYFPFLRNIALRKFKVAWQDVDALVHDVFATYLANPSAVRGDLHRYLVGAICNASRQHLRRGTKERALFCDEPVCAATPDDELIDGVVRNLILKATLARLGPSCRDTLERYCLNGETAASIARSRNTSAGYIWRLVNLCRNKLKTIYATMRRGS